MFSVCLIGGVPISPVLFLTLCLLVVGSMYIAHSVVQCLRTATEEGWVLLPTSHLLCYLEQITPCLCTFALPCLPWLGLCYWKQALSTCSYSRGAQVWQVVWVDGSQGSWVHVSAPLPSSDDLGSGLEPWEIAGRWVVCIPCPSPGNSADLCKARSWLVHRLAAHVGGVGSGCVGFASCFRGAVFSALFSGCRLGLTRFIFNEHCHTAALNHGGNRQSCNENLGQ